MRVQFVCVCCVLASSAIECALACGSCHCHFSLHDRQAAGINTQHHPDSSIPPKFLKALRFQYRAVVDMALGDYMALAAKQLAEAEQAAERAQLDGEEAPMESAPNALVSGSSDSDMMEESEEEVEKKGADRRGVFQEGISMKVAEEGEERPEATASAVVDNDSAPPRRQSHADGQEVASDKDQFAAFLDIVENCVTQLPAKASAIRAAAQNALESARKNGLSPEDTLQRHAACSKQAQQAMRAHAACMPRPRNSASVPRRLPRTSEHSDLHCFVELCMSTCARPIFSVLIRCLLQHYDCLLL